MLWARKEILLHFTSLQASFLDSMQAGRDVVINMYVDAWTKSYLNTSIPIQNYLFVFHICHISCVLCMYINMYTYTWDIYSLLFQTARVYSTPFTLWNRIITGEIRSTYGNNPFSIESLLQPGTEVECLSMILLYGLVPSWYNLPCWHTPQAMICKRRLEHWRRFPYHVVSENGYIPCHRHEIFVINKCISITRGLPSSQHKILPFSNYIEEYLVYMFSFLVWHTLQTYQLLFLDPRNDSYAGHRCTTLTSSPGLEYDINRKVIVEQSICRRSNKSNLISFITEDTKALVQCQVNQIKCDDNTCISQYDLCRCDHYCSAARCSCQMSNGTKINQPIFCQTACMPEDCFCPQHNFQCSSGGCIQKAAICDGANDCKDASDEFCAIRMTLPGAQNDTILAVIDFKYFCTGFLCWSGECIHMNYVNDLLPDCPGGRAEDEPNFLNLRYNGNSYLCTDPTHFPCVVGLPVCFTVNQLCLYEFDDDGNTLWCRDGAHLGWCADINCTNSYKCPESYCIPFHRVCDGHADCIHGEDEERCHQYVCKGLLRCRATKVCVHPMQVCDGRKHCPFADDEILCDLTRCPSNCSCVSYSVICSNGLTNALPSIVPDFIKHLSMINYNLTYPVFHNLCNQSNIIFMNLSRNYVNDICDSLQSDCWLHRNIRILDLSHNVIYTLK